MLLGPGCSTRPKQRPNVASLVPATGTAWWPHATGHGFLVTCGYRKKWSDQFPAASPNIENRPLAHMWWIIFFFFFQSKEIKESQTQKGEKERRESRDVWGRSSLISKMSQMSHFMFIISGKKKMKLLGQV